MNPFTRVLTAFVGIGMINHASGWAITPPPGCPTVTETTTACPTTCRFPICAILSTLTAHCGCPDPAPTVHATFSCKPADKCLPFPPPCPTLYTVTRVTDCTGPTSSSEPPPLSSSTMPSSTSTHPVSSSTITSCSSTISEPPPLSSEPSSSCTSSEPPLSSSESSIESSLPPESNTSEPPPLSESTTTSEPPVETTTTTPGPGPEPGTTESPTTGPSPTEPITPPSPGPSQSWGERRMKRPLWWLGLLF